jgi:hypothetical protein
LAQRIGERGDLMVAHLVAGQIDFWQGQFAAARAELEAALALYDAGEQRARTLSLQLDPGVNARMHLGWTLWMLGFPDQAAAAAECALVDARRIGQPFILAMALFWRAAVALSCGKIGLLRDMTSELHVVTTEHHIAFLRACSIVLDGGAHIAAGEIDSGMACLWRAFDAFKTQQAGLGRPWALSLAIAGCAKAGRRAEGLKLLEDAFAATRPNNECQYEAELHRLHAELLGSGPAAEEACRRAIAVARAQSARSLELRAATSLARLLAGRGAGDEAHALLTEALAEFTEGFDTADLRTARLTLETIGAARVKSATG